MRRFDEPISVRHPLTSAMDDAVAMQFVWRGKLWRVRQVLARWRETGAWWDSAAAQAVRGLETGEQDAALAEVDVWRVAATAGHYGASGVYELTQAHADGEWRMRAVLD